MILIIKKRYTVFTIIFCLVIAFLPLLNFIYPGTKEFNTVYLFFFSLICFVLCYVIKIKQIRLEYGLIDIFIGIYLIYSLFNIVFIRQSIPEPLWFIKWSTLILLYFISKYILRFNLNYFYYFIIAGGFLQSMLSILQYCSIIKFTMNPYFPHSGSFPTTGPLSAFLEISLICCICVIFRVIKEKNIQVLLFLFILSVIIGGIIITDNRGVYASLLILASIFLINYYSKRQKRAITVLIFIAIFLSTACFSIYLYNKRPASVSTRFLLWNVSKTMIDEHPYFGKGVGSFSKDYMHYQAKYFNGNSNKAESIYSNNHYQSYNIFIQIAVEQGVIGLLIFMLLVSTIIATSKNKCALFCFIGLLIVSCFLYTSDIYSLLILFPIFIGLNSSGSKSIEICRNSKFNSLIKAGIIVILFTITLYAVFSYKEYIETYKSLDKPKENSHLRLISRNMNFTLRFTKSVFNSNELTNKEKIEIIKMCKLRICTCEMICDLGDLYMKEKDYMIAEKYYIESFNMVPCRIIPLHKLFILYKVTNNINKTKEIANELINHRTSIFSSLTLRIRRDAEEYLKSVKPISTNK